jgi:phage repressor protein C with HTH and peptisase S24 domain
MLAERVGTGRSQIVKLERGERRLTDGWMRRLARELGFRPGDLLIDDLLIDIEPTLDESLQHHDRVVELAGEQYATIPVLDVQAAAGAGAWDQQEQVAHNVLFRLQWLRSVTNAPLGQLAMIEFSGDSMEPTIINGDHGLVDRTQTRPRDDGIYVFNYEGGTLVKRIRIDPVRHRLTITSDNPRYPPIEDIVPGHVRLAGRVIWLGRCL